MSALRLNIFFVSLRWYELIRFPGSLQLCQQNGKSDSRLARSGDIGSLVTQCTPRLLMSELVNFSSTVLMARICNATAHWRHHENHSFATFSLQYTKSCLNRLFTSYSFQLRKTGKETKNKELMSFMNHQNLQRQGITRKLGHEPGETRHCIASPSKWARQL